MKSAVFYVNTSRLLSRLPATCLLHACSRYENNVLCETYDTPFWSLYKDIRTDWGKTDNYSAFLWTCDNRDKVGHIRFSFHLTEGLFWGRWVFVPLSGPPISVVVSSNTPFVCLSVTLVIHDTLLDSTHITSACVGLQRLPWSTIILPSMIVVETDTCIRLQRLPPSQPTSNPTIFFLFHGR